jgi:hypothetical protein
MKTFRSPNQNSMRFPDAEKWLTIAREKAVEIIRTEGKVSADEVVKLVPFSGVSRNTIGALFKDDRFRTVGVRKSSTPSRKGALIWEWGLK